MTFFPYWETFMSCFKSFYIFAPLTRLSSTAANHKNTFAHINCTPLCGDYLAMQCLVYVYSDVRRTQPVHVCSLRKCKEDRNILVERRSVFGRRLTDATVSMALARLLGSAFNAMKRRLAEALRRRAATSSHSADTNLHFERVSFKSIHLVRLNQRLRFFQPVAARIPQCFAPKRRRGNVMATATSLRAPGQPSSAVSKAQGDSAILISTFIEIHMMTYTFVSLSALNIVFFFLRRNRDTWEVSARRVLRYNRSSAVTNVCQRAAAV